MSEINCNNCAISDFKESLCHRCDEMKRLGRAEDIEGLLIKAFSEVDSPAKSNCIERQAAIEAIEQMQMPIMRSEFPEEQFVFTGMSEALQAIKNLTSAQPERKTSEWLHGYLQTAVDFGIITETQAVRIMERVGK